MRLKPHFLFPVAVSLLLTGVAGVARENARDTTHEPAPHKKKGSSLPEKTTPGNKGKNSPAQQAVVSSQANLRDVRSRINTLQEDMADTQEDREEAVDQLRESEQQISGLQRDLHDLHAQHETLQTTLQSLKTEARTLEQDIARQQTQLERVLHRHYLQGKPDSLQLLFNGNAPNQTARNLYYLSSIARRRQQLIHDLRQTLARRKAVAEKTRSRAEELAQVEARQQQHQASLLKQREKHQGLVASLSDRIKVQRQAIGTLQQDERRLGQLIAQLNRTIAANAAKEAAAARARAEKAAQERARAEEKARAEALARTRQQEQARQQLARQELNRKESSRRDATTPPTPAPAPSPVTPEPLQTARQEDARNSERSSERNSGNKPPVAEVENTRTPEHQAASFARLRGSLALPARGSLSGRFGASREGGGTWRGVFIRAASGGEVRAIAAGKVVHADWMRGLGNLLIIDHGGGYLSIYGNNDSVLKQVGSTVRGGDTIASIGNSGGNPESGLYFELRHQGQAIDPMKWVSIR